MEEKFYRIVEVKDGEYYSLFHGTNRSRKLERGKWLKADKKTVKDGSCATYYESGFHVLKSKEDTERFFERMFRIKENRRVVPVLAKGIRLKSHSRHEVYLADEMFIL